MPPKTPRQSGASLTGVATPNLPTYTFGDIVLAKVKGHPAWPARIVDPYVSPLNLRDERKIAQKNSYLVKFFKTADYAWMNAKEMSILETTEIQAFINNPNKKGADLKAAYQIALAPEAWEAELEARLAADVEEYNAPEIDELETVDAEGAEKAVSAQSKQKRKRPSETKSPAISTKKRKSVDARATNVPAQVGATPEPPAAAPAVKKRGKKKEEPAAPVDGESVVREWRHRLQRSFLGKVPLTEKMMPEIDGVFNDIEQFEMKTEWLTSSKLAKVLKRVGVLEEWQIPLDAQYGIRARARALQEKWRHQLGLGDEPPHRPQTTDGKDEVKANGSVDDGNGKENTDPTGMKKVEEAAINGKEPTKPTKPSAPEGMKIDEDDPLPVKVAEVDETDKVVEAAPLHEAKITDPQSEAPEVAPLPEPTQTNGDHTAVNGQAESMEVELEADRGEAEAVKDEVSSETEAVKDQAEVVNGEPEAAKDEAEAEVVKDEAQAVNGEPKAMSAEPEAVNTKAEVVNDESEASNGITEETDGKPQTVSDEPTAVNGAHASLKEDEVSKAPKNPEADVEMVTTDAGVKSDEKTIAQESNDDDVQMDCVDTPEPTTVKNIDADKEVAV